MKRREFLTLLSTVGIAATLHDGLTVPSEGRLSSRQLSGGRLRFSHFRQGFGYPVEIELVLPNAGELDAPPPVVIAREGEESWFDQLDPDAAHLGGGVNRWVWEWMPAVVRPTGEEERAEVIRFRAAVLDGSDDSRGLCSEALEVVCARRGWGC
ncbi:MAG: hypothetical protein JW797_17815 [Bradymonadales bacterium]|nr:hypothetical protein [Bradymonadales bacterium]